MKNLYTILIALLIVSGASAQTSQPCSTCLPYGIEFTTQAEIDNFQTTYPNCTKIEGNLIISGDSINNLNGLSILTSLGGDFEITCHNSLNNLTGLEGLDTIWGSLRISGYQYGLHMCWNHLGSLTGLENVTFIGGHLGIAASANLSTLEGLDNLNSIGGNLCFGYLIGVMDPCCPNAAINNFTGLENLSSIGGELIIGGNYNLTSLIGLDNIDAGSITFLQIASSPLLSDCAVKSICDYLENPLGYILIGSNATGCNSQDEVEEACEAISVGEQQPGYGFSIYPNPSSNHFTLTFSLSDPAEVTLQVLNQVGQVVGRITEGYFPPGDHQIHFKAEGLTPGIYFLRISTTGSRHQAIEKMVVVR